MIEYVYVTLHGVLFPNSWPYVLGLNLLLVVGSGLISIFR